MKHFIWNLLKPHVSIFQVFVCILFLNIWDKLPTNAHRGIVVLTLFLALEFVSKALRKWWGGKLDKE